MNRLTVKGAFLKYRRALPWTLAICLLGAWFLIAAQPHAPRIPKTTGYCVTVVDEAGEKIGVTYVPWHQPDPAKLEEFRTSVRNAITLIGVSTGRQGVVESALDVQLIDNPIPPLHQPPGTTPILIEAFRKKGGNGCTSVCVCASVRYGSRAAPVTSDAPIQPDEIIGCGGPCGGCEVCTVTCSS